MIKSPALIEDEEKIKKQENEMYSPEMIDYALDGSVLVPEYARGLLAKALSLLPHAVIDYITENIVFISQDKAERGSYFQFNHPLLKNKKGFILLNPTIWRKKPIRVNFTIAHEVAHALKRHTVSFSVKSNAEQSYNQETEADRLAVEWLSKHYKKEDLMKICSYLNSRKFKKDCGIRKGAL